MSKKIWNNYSENITLVTCFFELNRGKWNKFNRTNGDYYKYFETWARIHNDLIVYCSVEHKEEIIAIREKYGRKNTRVVVIDDIFGVDAELYNSIKQSISNPLSIEYRLTPENPECWNVEYNYIMLMKEWCINHAIQHNYASGMIAWIDFGFNHGDFYYKKAEEFDFLWEHKFSYKVHAILVKPVDDLPIFEIVRNMNTYIQGCMIVAPDKLWIELWNLVRKNMVALNKVGLMDDDQTILLMAYRENSKIFEFENGQWFSHFAKWSDRRFTIQ